MTTVWTIISDSPEQDKEFLGVYATAEAAKAHVERMFRRGVGA